MTASSTLNGSRLEYPPAAKLNRHGRRRAVGQNLERRVAVRNASHGPSGPCMMSSSFSSRALTRDNRELNYGSFRTHRSGQDRPSTGKVGPVFRTRPRALLSKARHFVKPPRHEAAWADRPKPFAEHDAADEWRGHFLTAPPISPNHIIGQIGPERWVPRRPATKTCADRFVSAG